MGGASAWAELLQMEKGDFRASIRRISREKGGEGNVEMKEHGDEGLVGILKLCRVVRVSPHLQRDIHFLLICCRIGLVLESSGCSKLLGFGHVVGRGARVSTVQSQLHLACV